MKREEKIWLGIIMLLAAWWFAQQRRTAAGQIAVGVFEHLGEEELASALI